MIVYLENGELQSYYSHDFILLEESKQVFKYFLLGSFYQIL